MPNARPECRCPAPQPRSGVAEEQAAEQGLQFAAHRRDDAVTEVLRAAPEIAELADRIERTRQLLYDTTWICSAIGLRRLPFHWDGVLWAATAARGRRGKRRSPRSKAIRTAPRDTAKGREAHQRRAAAAPRRNFEGARAQKPVAWSTSAS
jgi:hypothetical protein